MILKKKKKMINAELSPIWKAYTLRGHVPFKFISILPGARSHCCVGEMSCRKLWPRLTLLRPSNCFLVSSNTHAFLDNFLYHKGLLFVFLCSQSCLTLCDLMDCSPRDSSVHGIFQARILEWVAISYFRDLPNPGIEPALVRLLGLLHRQAGSLPLAPPGKPHIYVCI